MILGKTTARWVVGGLSAASLFLAVIVQAEPVDDASRSAARKLGYSGVEAYQAGDFATAFQQLDKAYQVLHAPSLALWSARALIKLGKLVEANERLLGVDRLPVSEGDVQVQKDAQLDAQKEATALALRIPSLTVRVDGGAASGMVVTVDRVAIPPALVGESRPINPGTHVVEATAGNAHTETKIVLGEREHKTAVLTFAPASSAPKPLAQMDATPSDASSRGSDSGATLRTLGWIGVGVGGAGLAFGGVTGLVALGKKGDLDANHDCSAVNHVCGSAEGGAIDSYNSLRTMSSLGFVVGGVFAATGVVMLLGSPKRGSDLALNISGRGVVLSGGF